MSLKGESISKGCIVVVALAIFGAAIAGVVTSTQMIHGQLSPAAFGTASITSGVFSLNLPSIIVGSLALNGTLSAVLAAKIGLTFSALTLGAIALCLPCVGCYVACEKGS